MRRRTALVALLTVSLASVGCQPAKRAGYASNERQAIRIVATPALFRTAGRAGERLWATEPGLQSPVVEAMPAEQALALLCGGRGLDHPDAALVPVPPDPRALAACGRHGVPIAVSRSGDASAPAWLVLDHGHLGHVAGLDHYAALLGDSS